MGIKCRLIDRAAQMSTAERAQAGNALIAAGEKPQPGDMCFAPLMLDPQHDGWYLKYALSDEYKRDWLGKRPPIIVVLPNGDWFNVDSQISNGGGRGWTVTGEPPNITVSPSIHCIGRWHGWLRGGELC